MPLLFWKKIVHKYTRQGSTVHSWFMYMSKTLERVNDYLLRDKLRLKCVSIPILRLMEFALANSLIYVEYDNTTSSSWKALRGVRQGGILSAHLFVNCIDKMLSLVSLQESGCLLGLIRKTVHAYADDIVLFCPSDGGLRKLMKTFYESCQLHDFKINFENTKKF